MKNPAATLEKIAQQYLGLETLQERKADSLDFHELAVWSIEAALLAAYQAGSASSALAIASKTS